MDEVSEYTLATWQMLCFFFCGVIEGGLVGAGITLWILLPDSRAAYPIGSVGVLLLTITVFVLKCYKDKLRIRQREEGGF